MTAMLTNQELGLPENATADERAEVLIKLGAYRGLSYTSVPKIESEVESDQWPLPFALPTSQPIPHKRPGHLSREDDQGREERAVRALKALRESGEA